MTRFRSTEIINRAFKRTWKKKKNNVHMRQYPATRSGNKLLIEFAEKKRKKEPAAPGGWLYACRCCSRSDREMGSRTRNELHGIRVLVPQRIIAPTEGLTRKEKWTRTYVRPVVSVCFYRTRNVFIHNSVGLAQASVGHTYSACRVLALHLRTIKILTSGG